MGIFSTDSHIWGIWGYFLQSHLMENIIPLGAFGDIFDRDSICQTHIENVTPQKMSRLLV